jgi:hypothetical protein
MIAIEIARARLAPSDREACDAQEARRCDVPAT